MTAATTTNPSAPTIQETWARFHAAPTDELRNRLIEHYLPLVRYRAERLAATLPRQVDVEDLMSVGVFGLAHAIGAFDPTRNVKFETFAALPIRGAMLDELRSLDPCPRLVRERAAIVKRAVQRFETRFGRSPTREELAPLVADDPDEAALILQDGFPAAFTSLERPIAGAGTSDTPLRELDVLADEAGAAPPVNVQRSDLRELITHRLSRAEQLVIILYYDEQMTMKEIGATLDLSESRVSQMHTSIIARLKAQLRDREREFEPLRA